MPIGTRIEIDYDKVYMSNSTGPFRIVRELPSVRMGTDGKAVRRMVEIEFIETGTRKETQLQMALIGKVADPYYRSIAGVGYLGYISRDVHSKKEYDMWRNMILRCYDPSHHAYGMYGAIGVTVCERWHNFTNFYMDLQTLPGFYAYANSSNKEQFSLDKDVLQSAVPHNQRVYSPSTCIIMPTGDNCRLTARNSETTSEYQGVYRTSTGSFQASVNIDGQKYFLGTFSNELAAASAYNFVMREYGYQCSTPGVEFMPIKEALTYRTSRTPLKLPPRIDASKLDTSLPTSSNYTGVNKRGNNYMASYFCNGEKFHIGSFSNEIAAANAYNYYNQYYANLAGHVNNVPYMQPTEWLQYKTYARGKIPVEMCKIVDKNK